MADEQYQNQSLTLRERVHNIRERHPILSTLAAITAIWLVLKIINGLLRRHCSIAGSSPLTLDPSKRGNLTCGIQSVLDIPANVEKRLYAAISQDRVYNPNTGTVVASTPTK